MSDPVLKRRDKGKAVFLLQSFLNRVGAMLIADGDFGPATETGVRFAQDRAGQVSTGVADPSLWGWLKSRPEPFPKLETNGVAFIASEETGGLAYYDLQARWPHYPGEASGITIGIGYDLRWKTREDFLETWGDHLPKSARFELARDVGRRGTKKRVAELKRAGVEVPFVSAWTVFVQTILPRLYDDTQSIYPSLDRLPGLCRSVLVSLVFNRGTDLEGQRRREMKAIQAILQSASQPGLGKAQITAALTRVEDEIVSMKRLWSPGFGVVRRRQSEANLWRLGLAQR